MSDGADRSELDDGKPRLVLLSSNPDLLCLREAVLQQAGFDVFSTVDPEQASLWIQAGAFDALLLCFSLSETLQGKIAKQFQHSCPGKPIISIGRQGNGSHAIALADIFVDTADGPDALLQALREASETPNTPL
jgi:DNA-binding response OmpR family regulator